MNSLSSSVGSSSLENTSKDKNPSIINWIFLSFTDATEQKKYRKFRTIVSHNNFPYLAFGCWYFVDATLYFVYLFSESFHFTKWPLFIIIILNIATFSIIINAFIFYFRSEKGFTIFSQRFSSVDVALSWRDTFEEYASILRSLSQALILFFRAWNGPCAPGLTSLKLFMFCNSSAHLGTIPVEIVLKGVLDKFLDQAWFTNMRFYSAILSWLISVIFVVSSYIVAFAKEGMQVPLGLHLPSNGLLLTFVTVIIFVRYYMEKNHLEKYLLLTGLDGGGDRDQLIFLSRNNFNSTLQSTNSRLNSNSNSNSNNIHVNNTYSKSSISSISISCSGDSDSQYSGSIDMNMNMNGGREQELVDDFGTLISKLSADDVRALYTSARDDRHAEEQRDASIQQSMKRNIQDRFLERWQDVSSLTSDSNYNDNDNDNDHDYKDIPLPSSAKSSGKWENIYSSVFNTSSSSSSSK